MTAINTSHQEGLERLKENRLVLTPDNADDILALEEPIEKLAKEMYDILFPGGDKLFYVLNDSIPNEEFKGNLYYGSWEMDYNVDQDRISFGVCGENLHYCAEGNYGFQVSVEMVSSKIPFKGRKKKITITPANLDNNRINENYWGKSVEGFLRILHSKFITNAPDKNKYLEYTEMIFRFPGLIEKAHRLRNEQQDAVSSEVDGLLSRVRAAILEDKDGIR